MAKPARRPELIVAAVVRLARDLDARNPAPGAESQQVGVRAALLGLATVAPHCFMGAEVGL
jgi:hypothetical protein